jgi:hypothetical protein
MSKERVIIGWRGILRFSKWFYLVEGFLYFTYFGAAGPFQLSKKTRKTVVGRRLPKVLSNRAITSRTTTTIWRIGRKLR